MGEIKSCGTLEEQSEAENKQSEADKEQSEAENEQNEAKKKLAEINKKIEEASKRLNGIEEVNEERAIRDIKLKTKDEYSSMSGSKESKSWLRTILLAGSLVLIVMILRTWRETNLVMKGYGEPQKVQVQLNLDSEGKVDRSKSTVTMEPYQPENKEEQEEEEGSTELQPNGAIISIKPYEKK